MSEKERDQPKGKGERLLTLLEDFIEEKTSNISREDIDEIIKALNQEINKRVSITVSVVLSDFFDAIKEVLDKYKTGGIDAKTSRD